MCMCVNVYRDSMLCITDYFDEESGGSGFIVLINNLLILKDEQPKWED